MIEEVFQCIVCVYIYFTYEILNMLPSIAFSDSLVEKGFSLYCVYTHFTYEIHQRLLNIVSAIAFSDSLIEEVFYCIVCIHISRMNYINAF